MEPTIRKGEQSRDENNLPELDSTWEDVDQESEQQAAGNSSDDQFDQFQIDEDAWQALDDSGYLPGESSQFQAPDGLDIAQVEPDEQLAAETDTQSPTVTLTQAEPEELQDGASQQQSDEQVGGILAAPPEQSQDEIQISLPADFPFSAGDQGIPSDSPIQLQPSQQAEETTAEQTSVPASDNAAQFTTDFLPLPAYEEVKADATPRKVALILSGGGARGAFQVGAEKYAREVKGYQWDIIAGVSVGALNGAMLAMHRFTRLIELWDHISDSQVYTGGFNLVALVKILFGAKSFYGNEPLKNMMQREFEAGRILDDLHVGAVSLISGEYVQFTRESLELSKAILASASIPVVWPPVDVSADHPAMVDGGVRNITPIGDVLALEPDEIVIINCGNEKPTSRPEAASNVLSIGMRALDIMQNEIFLNDMKDFLRINALVKEASQQGVVLHHPQSGRPLKYFPCQVIEPDSELGDVLDFSQKSIQAALKAGVRRAREMLGRP